MIIKVLVEKINLLRKLVCEYQLATKIGIWKLICYEILLQKLVYENQFATKIGTISYDFHS